MRSISRVARPRMPAKRSRSRAASRQPTAAGRPRTGWRASSAGSSTRPPATSTTSAAQRRDASSQTSRSAPRSKRCEASVWRPSRFAPTRTRRRSKWALSSSTSIVRVGDLGREAAHDPGEARPRARVGDHQHLGSRARAPRRRASSASRPARARRTASSPPGSVARSKACSGWPGLPEHEVGDVDDVVDRAHADRLEPPRAASPATGPTFTPRTIARDVARAAFGVFEHHRRRVRRRPTNSFGRRGRRADAAAAAHHRELAREARGGSCSRGGCAVTSTSSRDRPSPVPGSSRIPRPRGRPKSVVPELRSAALSFDPPSIADRST